MLIFGVTELAKRFELSRSTIYRYVNDGMPCSQKNGRYIFDSFEVRDWLLSRTEKIN